MWCLILLAAFQIQNVVTFECGIVQQASKNHGAASRVVGGVDAPEGAWPWMVALASKIVNHNTNKTTPDFRCGGSLISHLHVLSAAHCSAEHLYLARMGSNNLASDSPLDVLIEKYIVHESFEFNSAYNDVAIALLETKVRFTERVHPICLPKDKWFSVSNYEGWNAYVAGWGDITEGSDTGSQVLQEVQIPMWNLEECNIIYKKFNANVTSNNLCAGYKEGGKDACQGDSGGPLMLRVGDTYYIIGIVSHGHGCGYEGVPGVFTRVNSYLEWIEHVMYKTRIEKILKRREKLLRETNPDQDENNHLPPTKRHHRHDRGHHYPHKLPARHKTYFLNLYLKKRSSGVTSPAT